MFNKVDSLLKMFLVIVVTKKKKSSFITLICAIKSLKSHIKFFFLLHTQFSLFFLVIFNKLFNDSFNSEIAIKRWLYVSIQKLILVS